jgi:hypothetical protein
MQNIHSSDLGDILQKMGCSGFSFLLFGRMSRIFGDPFLFHTVIPLVLTQSRVAKKRMSFIYIRVPQRRLQEPDV